MATNRRISIAAVTITVAVAAATNAALALFHLNARQSEIWPAFAPPGPAIGIVWIVLFAGMGAAYSLVTRRLEVAGLIVLCLAYPFYTHAIANHATELIGNAVTFAYAVRLSVRTRRESSLAAVAIACVAAWVAFATALVIALVRLNGWAT